MPSYMSAIDAPEAPIQIIGLPYDSTTSYRSGSRFGPEAVRSASYCLENYDPILDLDLEDISFGDAGDVEIPPGDPKRALSVITSALDEKVRPDSLVLGLGGEHLLTLPLVQRVLKNYEEKDLWFIHLDAHTDLRPGYLGEPYSHASIVWLVSKEIGFSKIRQLGIRSGTKPEWELMRLHNTLTGIDDKSVASLVDWIGDDPVYLSVDLDVMDASLFPGTGAPEPGGVSFAELQRILNQFIGVNIVGADVMELAPSLDPSGASSVVAAKVVRTMLFLMASGMTGGEE